MRKLTAEQTAARDARRAKFRALVADVAAMTDEQRAGIVARLGAVPTCTGGALSFFNSCLVLSQAPGASLVGGFQQWRKLGRIVRKGEHGAMIWIPTGQAAASADATGEATDNDADGARMRFITGTVFDVSQTDAMPEVTAHCGAAIAAWIDPAGSLQAAGLLEVHA